MSYKGIGWILFDAPVAVGNSTTIGTVNEYRKQSINTLQV